MEDIQFINGTDNLFMFKKLVLHDQWKHTCQIWQILIILAWNPFWPHAFQMLTFKQLFTFQN